MLWKLSELGVAISFNAKTSHEIEWKEGIVREERGRELRGGGGEEVVTMKWGNDGIYK